MAIPFLADIQLSGNQIFGLRLEVLAADPTGPDLYEGRLWFNSTHNLVKYYDGGTVIPLGIGVESISDLGPPTADVSWAGFKITNLANPTSAQDAATQDYVLAQIAALVDSSPGVLDTLNELAAALGDDANFSTTMTTALAALDTRLDALEATPALTRKVAFNVGNGVNLAHVLTHNLNTRDVQVEVYDATTFEKVFVATVHTTVNTVTVTFTTVVANNAYRATVIG
jgi:hypothetical protein